MRGLCVGLLAALCAADDSPCTETPSRYHTLCINNESIAISCSTTNGPVELKVYPHWEPFSARKLLHLVETTNLAGADFRSLLDAGKTTFVATAAEIEDDGFKNKRQVNIPASARGRVVFCPASSTFNIVQNDAFQSSDCSGSVAEVTSGFENFKQDGNFKHCSIPADRVSCSTTKGNIKIEVHPYWAPIAAARFLTLIEMGFYDGIYLWRVNGAIIQFGADEKDGRPKFNGIRDIQIQDDAHIKVANPDAGLPNYRIAHAGAPVPNSRDVGIFFVTHQNKHLGAERWEAGFADVYEGQDVIDSVYRGYGERVNVQLLYGDSNKFGKQYPEMDRIVKCSIDKKDGHGSATKKVRTKRHRRRRGGGYIRKS